MVLSHSRSTTIPASAAPRTALTCLAALALLLVLVSLMVPRQAAAQPAATNTAPRAGEVSLSVKDYLALAESAEHAEQARAAAKLHREPPLAEVVAQRTTAEIGEVGEVGDVGPGEARLVSDLEVLVQGHPQSRLALPLAGVALAVEVQRAAVSAPGGAAGSHASYAVMAGPAAAAAAMVDGGGAAHPGLYLVAAEPGRYSVRARSRASFASVHGESRVTLTPIVAQVAVLEIGLPAALDWECPGAVVVEDRVAGGRRHLRLSAGRGLEPVLALRRHVAGDQAAALLAQDDVVTLLQLRPEGLRRHDVVLYEVTRGALADLVIDLPPGFEVERAGTDEGEVQPIQEGNRLVVHRQRRLQGSGFLVLTTRPAVAAGLLPLGLITPQPPPRARFLAAAATVPGSLEPQPASSWARVDLGDLPRTLGDTLTESAELGVTTAWRLKEPSAGGAGSQVAAAAVRVITAPRAAALETVVRRRLTTTLLTVDGTLLHLDRFELAQAGEALSMALPAGATLWSAAVDGQPVRPLVAGAREAKSGTGGAKSDDVTGLRVPLGAGGARFVEVVAVLDKIVAKGRSQLAFELAQVQAPVLEHRWRLLLPENARYRFRAAGLRLVPEPAVFRGSAELRQAAVPPIAGVTARDPWMILQATPGVLVDRVNIGGNESGQQSTYVGPGASGLHGRVTDQNGAALPGTAVTVTGSERVPPRVQVADGKGEFTFSGLPPGTYQLKAELQGFSPVEVPGIRLAAARGTAVDLVLSSAVAETITVTSEASLLNESAIRVGSSLSQDELRRIPTARDPSQVLNDLRQGLVGGVRPLAVTVPQTGKALLLAGVLPPARVAVELDVRSGAK